MSSIEIDEAWIFDGASTEARDALDLLVKRNRIATPPAGMVDGEEYRAWLLTRVAGAEAVDVTDEEHEATAEWRERISSAPVDELWLEYLRSVGARS